MDSIVINKRKEVLKHEQDKEKRILELKKWFKTEYAERLNRLNNRIFLKLPQEETRYDIEIDAYNKEQELRKLEGLSPLPPVKLNKVI